MGYAKSEKIIIIEPSPIVVAGLKSIFTDRAGYEIVASFQDLRLLNERIISSAPDIIMINPFVLDSHNRYYIKQLFSSLSESRIFAIVYGYVEEEVLSQYDGVITIGDTAKIILDKLKSSVGSKKAEEDSIGVDLSVRETEILVAVAKGMTNKEISSLYNISVHTVISHRKNITRKIGIRTISGLTVYAMLRNLI